MPEIWRHVEQLAQNPSEDDERRIDRSEYEAYCPLMMSWIVSWAALALAVFMAAAIMPGIKVSGLWGSFFVAAIFGALNVLFGEMLVASLAAHLPATTGLTFTVAVMARFVVNAILLKVTDVVSSSLEVDGLKGMLFGALGISLFSSFAEQIVRYIMT